MANIAPWSQLAPDVLDRQRLYNPGPYGLDGDFNATARSVYAGNVKMACCAYTGMAFRLAFAL
jgi:hypothetical protein